MNWKGYEQLVAGFFESLGCKAEVGASVRGARGVHKVDVWVTFERFGLESKWVVECKFWKKSVTKEKVLARTSIVADVGADRGILISEVGFQSGATHAAQHTNIVLTSLDELKETARDDLISSALHTLELRATRLSKELYGLYIVERGPNSTNGRPRPGVDGAATLKGLGRLALLDSGLKEVRLRRSPFPVEFDEGAERAIFAATLEDFVQRASAVVADVERFVADQRKRVHSAEAKG